MRNTAILVGLGVVAVMVAVVIYASVQGFVKYVLRTSPALDSAHFSKPILLIRHRLKTLML